MLRPILVGGDKGQVHIGLRRAQKLDLGLLGRVFEPLQSEAIFAQVDAVLLFELTRQVIMMRLSRILAAEKGIAVGRLDLNHAVSDFEYRNVEGAAAATRQYVQP
jgi:hypothetical protein